jgi:hypothetical protein
MKLPPARFLFPINLSNFSPFQHSRYKWRNCPRRDFCFWSTCQVFAHSDTVAKNDEIAPGAIFLSDQSVKFLPLPTPSRKMTKLPPARFLSPINQSDFSTFRHHREKWRNCPRRDFCFRSTCQILAHSDTVAKNDEITLGAIFVSNQPAKFQPIPTPSWKMTKLSPAPFLFMIILSNFSPFRHRREKRRNWHRCNFCFKSTCQILAHSDTVAKNDEIAPGAIFVSDNLVKF